MNKEQRLYIYAPGRDFLIPYLCRALPSAEFVEKADEAERCIMISSTDVYRADEGTLIGENSPVDTASEWVKYEAGFIQECSNAGRVATVLRAADIIGTGMTGWPRELAEKIWRGTMMHIKGNEARVSVVHATDVAAAVAAIAGLENAPEGFYNITDGDNPTFHDLVEALAYRMKDKHVSTLSTWGQLWLGRLFYGKRLYRRITTNRTFDCSALCRLIAYNPSAVTNYLRTHIYDESSL